VPLSGSAPLGSARRSGAAASYTVIFKVAFSTFWFKFGATLRRQAERRDSGKRQKASNLAQPVSYSSLLQYTKFWYSALCLAPLSLRSAVAKPDAAYFSAPLSGRRDVSGIRLGDR